MHSRRSFLGSAVGLLAAAMLPGCADDHVVIGQWEVGAAEAGHTLYGFVQRKAGRAVVWKIRSHDGSFSGPLIVALPRLRSAQYDPDAREAIEFQVWVDGEWQWLGVATHRRTVLRGERYRAVLMGERIEQRQQDALSANDAAIVAAEEEWLDTFDA